MASQSVLYVWFFFCSLSVAENSLQQIHVIFRHGDRTPDLVSLYPTDPHLNDTYFPDGLGQLNTIGKKQEYEVGKALRKRYDQFLGKLYTPDIQDAWSTDLNRTKASLQLVLAGLWPPTPSQTWDTLLPWQPIPYNYLRSAEDTLLGMPFLYCPKYMAEYNRLSETGDFKEFMVKNSEIIEFINNNSGLKIKGLFDLLSLYFGLYAEQKNGRTLPEWTQKVFPEFLEQATILCYELQTYNNVLLQSLGGKMVQRVIKDAELKIRGELVPKNRKIYLYSGHEYNVAHILGAFGVFKPHIPSYASYILIEFHKVQDNYGFKILYENYETKKPKYMIIPGCEEFCLYEKFVEITNKVIPQNNSC